MGNLVQKDIIAQGRGSKCQVHAWNALTDASDNNFAYVNKRWTIKIWYWNSFASETLQFTYQDHNKTRSELD